jgi:ABC-type glycerol-3-phosphate transport system substrate-binding protein
MKTGWTVRVLIVVAVVILSGCAGGSPLGSSEPVTLRYVYDGATPEIRALLDEYTADHPNVTVELLDPGNDGNAVSLPERMANGELDLVRGGVEALALAEQGLLLPLDDLNLDDWADERDDYYGGTWESLALLGQQYGIPAGLDTVVTFVNMDAAETLNVELPPEGAAWDSYAFLDLATRLNYPEGLPGGPARSLYGFCSDHEQLDPFVFVYANGGSIVDDLQDPQRPMLDDPKTVDALAWYVDLFGRYGVAPKPGFMGGNYGAAGLTVAQVGGYCGLWLGMFSERGFTGGSPWKFDWEMLTVPGSEGDLGLAMVEGYFVPKGSRHPDEALRLARYLSDSWPAAGGLLPPRRSLLEDPSYAQVVGDRIVAQASGFADSMTIISIDFSPRLMDVGIAALEAVNWAITQDDDIVPLLQSAQQDAERAFAQ